LQLIQVFLWYIYSHKYSLHSKCLSIVQVGVYPQPQPQPQPQPHPHPHPHPHQEYTGATGSFSFKNVKCENLFVSNLHIELFTIQLVKNSKVCWLSGDL